MTLSTVASWEKTPPFNKTESPIGADTYSEQWKKNKVGTGMNTFTFLTFLQVSFQGNPNIQCIDFETNRGKHIYNKNTREEELLEKMYMIRNALHQ